ncbi:hypothetical protein SAMN05444722_1421 [Rhodovulum sp. ES.010]|uniref:hypothetical protein n=1 Tax=Rhodovulum sp. ES.010 TaxID=1882821 RepID=UPI00092B4A0D|nr:hypothetical protein [Rhodovulum sp. ES.010]SIO32103.1 hypothetical protein SAMN05444722_1421 [Rhodovulum sp. ES.010]
MTRRILSTLAALVLGLGAGAASAQALNPGYAVTLEPGTLVVTYRGETVFEVRQDPQDPLFVVQGLRDMTGNGDVDLAVIWRRGRSAAHFAFGELRRDGFALLRQEQGMTPDILSAYGHLTQDQAARIAQGESLAPGPERRRPLPADLRNPAPDPAPEPSPGHWSFQPGSWDTATSAVLAWVRAGAAEDSFSEIRFRCPDNGDDIWVLVDRQHDRAEDVPRTASLVADGMEMPVILMPQLSDQTGNWYPIGTLGRDVDLFARLARAGSVALAYGDEWVTLIANGPEPRDEAAVSMFMTRCGVPTSY